MTGFSIYTVDGDVFYAESYSWDTEGLRPDGSGVTLLVFRPTNGPDRGKAHKVPIHRVERIVDHS